MLLVIHLDSESTPWLTHLMEGGMLPNLARLARTGMSFPVKPVVLPGAAYPTYYTGWRAGDLGYYFPVQWSASEQRAVNVLRLPLPETVFERAERHGVRMIAIDPPECPAIQVDQGYIVSGLQFEARVLLHRWSTDRRRTANLMNRLGPSGRADEIFGDFSESDARYLRRSLLPAPARLESAALQVMREEQPDCLWVNCCGLHIAGHQFFELPHVRDARLRRELEGTRLELAIGYDRMIGSLMDQLPAGSPVFVYYAKGMDTVTQWSDLLPRMLRSILGGPEARQRVNSLRRLLPRSVRRVMARTMSDQRAMDMLASLWSPRVDWAQTRAFTLPTDGPGFLRINLRGRERDGIVADHDVAGICEEICAGLGTFTDWNGKPCVESIVGTQDLCGSGLRMDQFPDLVVRWSQRPDTPDTGVRSPRFGEIRRESDWVGRSGNHTYGGMAIIEGGRPAVAADHIVQPEDFSATVLNYLGVPYADLPGRALLN